MTQFVCFTPEAVRAQLTAPFWQVLAQAGLSPSAECFTDEQQLLDWLACCNGEWLLLVIGRPSGLGELQRLDNRCSGLLVTRPSLSLALAVYDWQAEKDAVCQAHGLLALINSPWQHRRCLPCDVEFDAEWSALPPYRYRVLLCTGARCARRGSLRLWKQLADLLAQQGLLETAQGALLVKTHCQFPCNHGPVVTVYPGEYWYGIRQPADVQKLVTQHIKNGQPVAELLLDLPLLPALPVET